jgi:diadenosine tetraphosphate (Ap4A) HIT family hydrolase
MDKYPAVKGHKLYIPKMKDAPGMIGLCFQEAYRDGQEMVKSGEIDGFNIAMNINEAAGQSIFWPHVHFLPRHKGDIKGRNAGIRNAVAEIDPYNPENNKGGNNV